jgi:hypothetical protein
LAVVPNLAGFSGIHIFYWNRVFEVSGSRPIFAGVFSGGLTVCRQRELPENPGTKE